MNLPTDFIPISLDGMSVITALVFFPLFFGCVYLFTKLDTRINKRTDAQDVRIGKQDDAINAIRVTLAEVKGDMRETRAGVRRIDDGMSDIAKMHRDMLVKGLGGE